MRAAVYSPYLDTFGGGEKYMMTIAETISKNDFFVDVLLDRNLYSLGQSYLKDQLSKRFNLNLSKVNFIKAPIGKFSNYFSRIIFLKKYDVFFYLTDGSIFFPSARKNILHIQSPLRGERDNMWRKVKLGQWDLIIYNSKFTQTYSQDKWRITSEVIYPPVDVEKIKSLKKKKYILSVGRFFGYLRDKKHSFLIKAFRNLFESGKLKGWSLHLVGSAGKGDKDYLQELRKQANNLAVKFYPNLGYDILNKLFGESSIYWHAAGFGENDPIKMEHFGISTVEAMAGGCVPVVINKGGQTEIVQQRKSGFLWDNSEELTQFTLALISNNKLRERVSMQAHLRAKLFDKKIFEQKIKDIVSK